MHWTPAVLSLSLSFQNFWILLDHPHIQTCLSNLTRVCNNLKKKKKPTTPKQTDMPIVLFSIIVPCYRHAIHHAIHQWPTRSLPRCVYVYMMQINCFFMLNSALWCWHHQSPTLKTAYSDTENKRMTIVFKNLVSNFKSNCKASLMFYFFSNKIFKHCTQAPSLLWEVTGLLICGCRFPRGHCSSLTWPWPDHRPLFV